MLQSLEILILVSGVESKILLFNLFYSALFEFAAFDF